MAIDDAARCDKREVDARPNLLQQREDVQSVGAAEATAFGTLDDQTIDARICRLQRLVQAADLG